MEASKASLRKMRLQGGWWWTMVIFSHARCWGLDGDESHPMIYHKKGHQQLPPNPSSTGYPLPTSPYPHPRHEAPRDFPALLVDTLQLRIWPKTPQTATARQLEGTNLGTNEGIGRGDDACGPPNKNGRRYMGFTAVIFFRNKKTEFTYTYNWFLGTPCKRFVEDSNLKRFDR